MGPVQSFSSQGCAAAMQDAAGDSVAFKIPRVRLIPSQALRRRNQHTYWISAH